MRRNTATWASGRAPAFLLAAGTALLLAGAPRLAEAGDRSVTILEGVEEPPEAAPAPAGAQPLAALTTDNPAGLTIEIRPNPHLPVGTKVAFAVTTQRPGYLVLVDIGADGKLTQIYPNVMSLSRSVTGVALSNAIKPGPAVLIPNATNPLARFVFQADLPKGNGAIVAILSDSPLQIMDLPDLGAEAQAPQALVDGLSKSVKTLRIASTDGTGSFREGVWSFAATPYAVE